MSQRLKGSVSRLGLRDAWREPSADSARLVTFAQRLDALSSKVDQLQTIIFARLDRLEQQVADMGQRLEGQTADMRERLARLEASREADRAQMQADLARFMAEVERAETRLSRLAQLREARPLPEQGEPQS